MHNPAGFALFLERRQLQKFFIAILGFVFLSSQIPVLQNPGFFVATRHALADFTGVVNKTSGVTYFTSVQEKIENMPVTYSASEYSITVLKQSLQYPNIQVTGLNLSNTEIIVVGSPGLFGRIAVGYDARLGTNSFIPLRFARIVAALTSQNPRAALIYALGSGLLVFIVLNFITNIPTILSRKPKVLVLLC